MPRKPKREKPLHYKIRRAATKQKLMATPITALAEFSGLSVGDLRRMKDSSPGMFANIASTYSDQQRIIAFRRTLNK